MQGNPLERRQEMKDPELRPAPEGQPTSSIRLYLEHSENRHVTWATDIRNLEERLSRARAMADGYAEEVRLYKHQIQLREHEGRDD